MKYEKFVILGQPRTGSTYLVNLLNSHPQIHCANELFHPVKIFYEYGNVELNLEKISDRDLDPISFLVGFYERDFNNKKSVGFKLMFEHNSLILDYLIENKDIKIVYISRNNKLAQISSFIIALRTEKWSQGWKGKALKSVKDSIGAKNSHKIEFDKDHFTWLYRKAEIEEYMFKEVCKLKQRNLLELEYKELFSNEVLLKLSNFLGVDNCKLQSNLYKQNSTNPLDRFINKDEVISFCKAIGKEEWLEDELISS